MFCSILSSMIEVYKGLIRRPTYLNAIKPFIGKGVIKVLVGQRRVGKSYVLKDIENYIYEIKTNAHCIFISTEFGEGRNIETSKELYQYIEAQLLDKKENFVFIDEIQEIHEFEKALQSLLAENRCDIYCTGSNANLLSGELATRLRGRYIKIRVFPLSYKEFLYFYKKENSIESCLLFLQRGGMPFLYSLPLEQGYANEYLKNVSESILYRDVVAREKIRNINFLENLVHYLSDNTGSLFSASNISKYLKNQKININVQTVLTYLRALENSFIVSSVKRKEVGGLKIFEIGEKYYFEDTGIRNINTQHPITNDSANILETAVYNYLCQSGFTVFVGQLAGKEIDFIGEKQNSRIYVQVCLTIQSPNTYDREIGNLLLIKDNFPKYLVSLDPFIQEQVPKGIICMHAKDFFSLDW